MDDNHAALSELPVPLVGKPANGQRKKQMLLIWDAKVAILKKIVSDDFILMVLKHCVLGVLDMKFRRAPVPELAGNGALTLKALIFSILDNECRTNYQSNDGEMHSNFRAGVVLSIVRTSQMDIFGLWANTDTELVSSNKTGSKEVEGRTFMVLRKPVFLNYVTQEQVENMRKISKTPPLPPEERKNKAKLYKPSGRLTQEEFAVHATRNLFSIITSRLQNTRDSMKLVFFEELHFCSCCG